MSKMSMMAYCCNCNICHYQCFFAWILHRVTLAESGMGACRRYDWMHWEPFRLLPIQILCKDNIRWLWMPVNAIECVRIREIASAPRLQASHALVLHTSDCTTLQSQASRGENISDCCVLWAIRYKWAYTIYFFVHIILAVQLAGASQITTCHSKIVASTIYR